MVRLDRGGTEFLTAVTRRLHELGAGSVFSPALYGSATGVWRRSGFGDYADLDVMERPLATETPTTGTHLVREEPDPDWDQILTVDRAAFEGFWGMSRLGLSEAHRTNRAGTTFVATNEDGVAGYAIVGSQWGTVYLHRIAVHPDHAGQGLGGALLTASIDWGDRSGGRSIILNVRPENTRARRFYERHGFSDTGTRLRVLRRHPDQLLN
jgi:ribosomal protein S18 acetylase RimI-like enzyme